LGLNLILKKKLVDTGFFRFYIRIWSRLGHGLSATRQIKTALNATKRFQWTGSDPGPNR